MKKFYRFSFLALVINILVLNACFAISDNYTNNLLNIDVKDTSSEEVNMTLYTKNAYPIKIVPIKRSESEYVIILPETYHSMTSKPDTAGAKAVKDIDVKLLPYLGSEVNNGYTKIIINTKNPNAVLNITNKIISGEEKKQNEIDRILSGSKAKETTTVVTKAANLNRFDRTQKITPKQENVVSKYLGLSQQKTAETKSQAKKTEQTAKVETLKKDRTIAKNLEQTAIVIPKDRKQLNTVKQELDAQNAAQSTNNTYSQDYNQSNTENNAYDTTSQYNDIQATTQSQNLNLPENQTNEQQNNQPGFFIRHKNLFYVVGIFSFTLPLILFAFMFKLLAGDKKQKINLRRSSFYSSNNDDIEGEGLTEARKPEIRMNNSNYYNQYKQNQNSGNAPLFGDFMKTSIPQYPNNNGYNRINTNPAYQNQGMVASVDSGLSAFSKISNTFEAKAAANHISTPIQPQVQPNINIQQQLQSNTIPQQQQAPAEPEQEPEIDFEYEVLSAEQFEEDLLNEGVVDGFEIEKNKGLYLIENNGKYSFIGTIRDQAFMLKDFEAKANTRFVVKTFKKMEDRHILIAGINEWRGLVEVNRKSIKLIKEF